MKWIWQNKEWLFSGAGVSVVLAVIWLYRTINQRNVPATSSTSSASPAQVLRFTTPTPLEMRSHLASAPPFQQKAAGEAYKGLKVCWPAVLDSVDEDQHSPKDTARKIARRKAAEKQNQKPTEWIVILKYDDPIHRYYFDPVLVLCYGIDLDKYQRLKFAPANEAVVVSGTIDHVSVGIDHVSIGLDHVSVRVDLIDVNLEFT